MSETIARVAQDDSFDYLESWLKQHYDPEHGFVRIERPIPNPEKNGDDIVAEWAEGPFVAKVVVNAGDLSICVELDIIIPLYGTKKLASGCASLKDGLTLDFNILIAKGFVNFRLENKDEVWLKYDVTGFGKHYSGDFKLLTL